MPRRYKIINSDVAYLKLLCSIIFVSQIAIVFASVYLLTLKVKAACSFEMLPYSPFLHITHHHMEICWEVIVQVLIYDDAFPSFVVS